MCTLTVVMLKGVLDPGAVNATEAASSSSLPRVLLHRARTRGGDK